MSPLNLSDQEVETLILALEVSGSIGLHAGLVEKLRASIRPARYDATANDPARPIAKSTIDVLNPDFARHIREAIARECWLRIDYDGGTTPGERVIKPLELRLVEQRWYLIAADARSRERRRFRHDRLRTVIPCLDPPDADAIVAAVKTEPDYADPANPFVRARLTEAGVRFCADHPHFRRSLIGNQVEFNCPPNDLPYCAREFLRLGTDCVVLGPPELISDMKSILEDIHTHLESNRTL